MRKDIFHDHKAHSIYDKGTLNCFSFGGSNVHLSGRVRLRFFSRVWAEYKQDCILNPSANPIRMAGLVVRRHECQLYINDLVIDGDLVSASDDGTRASGATNAATSDLHLKRKMDSSELQVILSQLTVLRKQNEVLSTELDIMRDHFSKNVTYISDTMNRFAAIPATLSKT